MSRAWGGSPTHTLSPALFSHPLFSAQCWGYVRCPQSAPNPSFDRREIPFSIEAISSFIALPLQARLGLLFLFLLFFCPSALRLLPMGRLLVFPHFGLPGFPSREKPGAFTQEKTDASYPRVSLGSCLWQLLLTTAPHGSNGVDSGLLSKLHTGVHRVEFGSHRLFFLVFLIGNPTSCRSRW